MRMEIFQTIPKQAMEIRKTVFVDEQGFQNEFDDIDFIAVHFVLFDDLDMPIATCRVFKETLIFNYNNHGKSFYS